MNPFEQHGPEKREEPRNDLKKQVERRMYLLIVCFVAGFLGVAVKLFFIQVRDQAQARDKARNQYESKEILKPLRGMVYDRNRIILASNTYDVSIVVDAAYIHRIDTVRLKNGMTLTDSIGLLLSNVLKIDRAIIDEKLRRHESQYVVIEKRAPKCVEEQIAKHLKPGIRIIREPRRQYPFESLAGQVIGYTNVENKGMCGIELEYNDQLAGKEGYVVNQRDGRGYVRPVVDNPRLDPVNGRHIVLTLDQTYQSIAEEELQKGVQRFEAGAGSCIILNPKSGEILAMANFPLIQIQDRTKYDPKAERNRTITDIFEPGSTYKIVTSSAALNESAIALDERIDAEHGVYRYNESLPPILDTHPYGMLTLREAIQHSSNIFMVKLARRLGAEALFTYARKFGFGVPTGIDLPGEISGTLKKPGDWDESRLLFNSFGYQIAVNSLQIACAYAAIANDGVLMQPYIKRWLLDENRNILEENTPRMVRRVVSPGTAKILKDYLEGVVANGTARLARVEGMRIAGKTGTAQQLVNGAYSKSSYYSSFVGFFPAEDPKVLIFVLVDAPNTKYGYTGGSISAPIFREIATRIINASSEFADKPEQFVTSRSAEDSVVVPNLIGLHPEAARHIAAARGLKFDMSGSGSVIEKHEPPAGVRCSRGVTLRVLALSQTKAAPTTAMPDVIGMTARQATRVLQAMNLQSKVTGSGIVLFQNPLPGQTVEPRSICMLSCAARKISEAKLY